MAENTVLKRSGELQNLDKAKIETRIKNLCKKYNLINVNYKLVATKVLSGIVDKMDTIKLDELIAGIASSLNMHDPDYDRLAALILMSNLHKSKNDYLSNVAELHKNKLIDDKYYNFVVANYESLLSVIDYDRDFEYEYTCQAVKTLINSELKQCDSKILETPQELHMRTSVYYFPNNPTKIKKNYDYISKGLFTHSTPAKQNAGSIDGCTSSCYLVMTKGPAVSDIYSTLKNCANATDHKGGVGISVSNVPATGSINPDGSIEPGLISYIKLLENTCIYSQKGGTKRRGGYAIYTELWHDDIFDVLSLKKNAGKGSDSAKKLFYGLWISDLFMKRTKANENWSLFCPLTAPGLSDCWGDEFDKLYLKYEKMSVARRVVPAQQLWWEILNMQIESGMPYMLYKDTCNRYSNQQHLGTIKSSNLCTEIIEYSASDEIAVCNLASISIPKFIKNGDIDHQLLFEVTYHITEALNNSIDNTYYPMKYAKRSNMKHRPIAIGIQGLADAYMMLDLPYTSEKARIINKEIYETLYYGFCRASCDIAKQNGKYESFDGSFTSKGILHYMHFGVKPSGRWDFEGLRKDIVEHGMANALGIGSMPTATSSIVLGNNEGFEPFISNMYTHKTLSLDSFAVNKHLVKKLKELDLWTNEIKEAILNDEGSVLEVKELPQTVKDVYKTAWEIPMKDMVDMARDRMPWIDQSQSFNCFMTDVTKPKLTSYHFYAWESGLKTGMYYLRTKSSIKGPKAVYNKEDLGCVGVCGA